MTLRLTIIALLLTTLTASAWTQQQLMRRAYGVRGAVPVVSLGGAVSLNGINEYFIDTASVLSNATSATAFGWYKTSKKNFARIIVHERSTGSSGFGVGIAVLESTGADAANGKIQGHYRDSSGVFRVIEGPVVTNDAWHYVVFSVSGTNGYLYHDGSLAASTNNVSVSQSFPVTASLRSFLGYGITAGLFSGLLDDLGLMKNRALTASDALELWNSGNAKSFSTLTTGTSGLVRHWKMDDGSRGAEATNALESVSSTYAAGTEIGASNWTNGIVPLP